MKKQLMFVTSDGKAFTPSEGLQAENHEFNLKLEEVLRRHSNVQLTPKTIAVIISQNKEEFQKLFTSHTSKTVQYRKKIQTANQN